MVCARDSVNDMVDRIGARATRIAGGISMDSSFRSRVPMLASVLLAGIVTAAAGCASDGPTGTSASRLQSQYERVVREVLPSVVQITTDSSTGSGVVYDNQGDIVTNAHVVGGATTVRVQESVGNTSLTAKTVGKFAPDDLEVIRVENDAGNLKPARFADSNNVQ